VLLLCVGCGACGGGEREAPAPEPASPVGGVPAPDAVGSTPDEAGTRTYFFACEEGGDFVVRLEGRSVWVFAPEGTRELPQVPAGSGAKYSDGTVTFWSRGAEAMLDFPGKSYRACTNDPARAVWEHAKLNGADFRATGNEPPWVLEMYPDRIVLVTGYRKNRREFPAAEPRERKRPARTEWETTADGTTLRITATPGPCADTMSGDLFASTVTWELGSESGRGCGRALH
jgi:membrane-bound inhibitor of C-type lysozyme/uncharacterized membrane protein